MDAWEENVRLRAYQIQEQQGRTGNLYDHRHEAGWEPKAEESAASVENLP